jgi:hypothetical protein
MPAAKFPGLFYREGSPMKTTARKTYINPAFHRHRAAAAIVGRILAAFGELEYLIVNGAGKAINNKDNVLRALYRLRATSSRIEAADALMRNAFVKAKLESEYLTMIVAVWRCHAIRNQYAHCNWADDSRHSGLFFTDLQESAKADVGFTYNWKHVNVALLREQEAYFVYAQDWFHHVDEELALRERKLRSHPWPKPKELTPPPSHNSPTKHIPPWLNADQKAQHLARARAAEGGAPTPTVAQQALDKARAEKRARQAEQRRKSREGDQSAKERSNQKG